MYLSREFKGAAFASKVEIADRRIDRVERKAWLESIAWRASKRLDADGRGHLGPLQPVPIRQSRTYFAGLRSRPQSHFGGIDLLVEIASHTSRDDRGLPDAIARTLELFDEIAPEISRLAREVRSEAHRLIDAAGERSDRAKFLAFGCVAAAGTRPKLSLTVEAIGPDLRPGRQRIDHVDPQALLELLDEMLWTQGERAETASRLADMGASCLVDTSTLAVLEALGLDPYRTCAGMDRHGMEFTAQDAEGSRYEGQIDWIDGSAAITFRRLGTAPLEFAEDWLQVSAGGFPEDALFELPGRPLAALAALPWMPADAIIEEAQRSDGVIEVRLTRRRVALTKRGPLRFEG